MGDLSRLCLKICLGYERNILEQTFPVQNLRISVGPKKLSKMAIIPRPAKFPSRVNELATE